MSQPQTAAPAGTMKPVMRSSRSTRPVTARRLCCASLTSSTTVYVRLCRTSTSVRKNVTIPSTARVTTISVRVKPARLLIFDVVLVGGEDDAADRRGGVGVRLAPLHVDVDDPHVGVEARRRDAVRQVEGLLHHVALVVLEGERDGVRTGPGRRLHVGVVPGQPEQALHLVAR